MRLALALGLFLATLLLSSNTLATHGSCQIIGMVYGSTDVAQVDAILRDDEICLIKVQRFERHLVFTTLKWRVEVDIPKDVKGWVRFRYPWGHADAYFGIQAVPVLASPQELG